MRNYAHEGHTFCGLAMLQYSLSPDDWQLFPNAKPTLTMKQSHAPPLFVHANLLKHAGGYTRASALATIKRMADDSARGGPDRARTKGFSNNQGICFDLWDAFDDLNPRTNRTVDPTYENGELVLESTQSAFGGVLSGFDDM